MDAPIFCPSARLGFGNIITQLCDYIDKYGPDALVHSSLKDFERGKAFSFNVKFTDEIPMKKIEPGIYCNPVTFNKISQILPKIMKPSAELLNLDMKFKTALHIRCGAGVQDSKGLAGPHDSFVTQATFNTIDSIIAQVPGPIFVASDSTLVKTTLKQKWGDKLVMFNSSITLSCDPSTCGGVTQSPESLMDAYKEWYIISQCENVYTTMGPGFCEKTNTGAGLSTYGFTAAAFNKRQFNILLCDGRVARYN